jgi:hypothetical protein
MFRLNIEGAAAIVNAVNWFVLVNVLGVVFLCGRTVVRWLHRGLQEYLFSMRADSRPLAPRASRVPNVGPPRRLLERVMVGSPHGRAFFFRPVPKLTN